MPVKQISGPVDNYKIKVQGRLDQNWADWFDGLEITVINDEQGKTVTVLSGPVADQVSLHGLLDRISDLGLTLLSVERLSG